MTQSPYYPAGPQQPYPGQPAVYAQPAAPAQPQYPVAPQQPYPPQQYTPPQPPPVPLAQGNLDDYYAQPSAGSGPSISWSANGQQKPIGTYYEGIVARDVTNADVQQQTDPNTGQPKVYRDGRPQFVMKVPLKVQPSPEFPEGEATWFVRGQARDELVRAMAEAGCDGAPRGGAAVRVTLVHRRPTRMGNPANVVQVVYQPAPGQANAQPAAQAPAPAPTAPSPAVGQLIAQQAPEQPATQVQAQYPPVPPQVAQSVQGPPVQVQPQVAPAQPVAPQGQAFPAPADLSAEQQELLARLTGQGAPTA